MDQTSPNQPALIMKSSNKTFPLLEPMTTLGRKAGNSIIIRHDPKISRQHAIITAQENQYVLQDMGSANGTYINEERVINSQSLKDGDKIRLGDTIFELQIPFLEEDLPTLSLDDEEATLPGTMRSPVAFVANNKKNKFTRLMIVGLVSGLISIGMFIFIYFF